MYVWMYGDTVLHYDQPNHYWPINPNDQREKYQLATWQQQALVPLELKTNCKKKV
jgi:hypothetical protein